MIYLQEFGDKKERKMKKITKVQSITYIFIYILIISFLIITGFYPVFAYVMESNNYRIQSDSLNIGGVRQTSTNYIMEDTIGEISTGPSDSASYKLKAGYQQMQEVYLSISSPSNFTMKPDIPGITGNPGSPASGEATWTVITDSPSGFNMKIKASTDPALKLEAGQEFTDYTPASAGSPDYTWATPGASAAEFGFTVEPETAADTVNLFLDDDGANCDTGSTNNTNTCWFDFNDTNDIDIINRSSRTDSDGEDEIIKFRAESNEKLLKEGNYTATITVTVAAN